MNNISKKVKEKIKQYSNEEYLDGYIKNEFLSSEGNANIILKVEKKDEIFDSKTVERQLNLRDDIYNYIDAKSAMLRNSIKLQLKIVGINLNSTEKERLKHIISEHYAIELYKIQKEYNIYKVKVIKLLLIGILFLVCYAMTFLITSNALFIDIFGFLFSFALWEAFDTLIFQMSEIKLERESITQKLIMDIDFELSEK